MATDVKRYGFLQPAPADFLCSICHSEDPEEAEGAVAHEDGGELHPLHYRCLLDSGRFRYICPACQAETDVSAISSLTDKCKGVGKRVWDQYVEPGLKAIASPFGEFSSGLPVIALGEFCRSPLLKAVGLGLQSHGLNRGMKTHEKMIPYLKEVYKFLTQVELCLKRGEMTSEAMAYFRREIQNQPPLLSCYEEAREDLESEDLERFAKGIERLKETIQERLWGNRILRALELAAGVGAVYYGIKSLKK